MNKPHILFLADTTHHTRAVTDHIKAITTDDRIHWHLINPLTCKVIDKLDLSMFHGIGLHYSVKPYNHYYLSSALRKKIAAFQGVKFLFLQDEYQKVNLVQEFLYSLGFHILFTLVNRKIMDKAYPDPRLSKLKKIQILTGYVPDDMKSIISPPIAERSIDVSYRGRRCEYWLGKLAHDKEKIATEFIKRTKETGLRLDISLEEADRVYGEAWLNLLKNSKAVLGTESGASIWDFDDSIRKNTYQFIRKHKHSDFDMVYEQVLKPFDGKIMYNAISPRVFEAAATRTPMIMFPGEYNDVCTPDVHYIALTKDFSNLAEVLEKLKDTHYLQSMANKAYTDLIESDLYSQHKLSKLVGDELLLLLNNARSYQTSAEISQEIVNKRVKYKFLNRARFLFNEVCFIVNSFFHVLFDPQYSLREGIKRYIAYLGPRITRRNKVLMK